MFWFLKRIDQANESGYRKSFALPKTPTAFICCLQQLLLSGVAMKFLRFPSDHCEKALFFGFPHVFSPISLCFRDGFLTASEAQWYRISINSYAFSTPTFPFTASLTRRILKLCLTRILFRVVLPWFKGTFPYFFCNALPPSPSHFPTKNQEILPDHSVVALIVKRVYDPVHLLYVSFHSLISYVKNETVQNVKTS